MSRDESVFSLIRERSAEIIDAKHFEAALHRKKPLRVKLGIDATSPHLHLGHVVNLRMLKTFQDAGHHAILIIGDFTGMIGDPSGRSTARVELTQREIKTNERTYLTQLSKIIDLKKTEVRHNSEWHAKMRLKDFFSVLSNFSIKSAWEREDFQNRLASGRPVQLHEAMYHVLQGYDSVVVKANVELGAIDQRLNLFAGRELQGKIGQEPQDIVMTPLLIGLDGAQKMSKSVGNTINITDAAKDMFGKVMTIPDNMIVNYAKFAAWMDQDEVESFEERLHKENPRDVKYDLAEAVAALYHGASRAQGARAEFIRTFSEHDSTSSGVSIAIPKKKYKPLELLQVLGVVQSKSEARRLIQGRAVEVDGHIVDEARSEIPVRSGSFIRVGKKTFFRVQ